MNNSYKVLGVILLTAFSAVSAMDEKTNAESRYLRNAVSETRSYLTRAPEYLNPADVNQLKDFCVATGKQKHAYQLEKARHQGIVKKQRDVQDAVFGQPQAARFLNFPNSSSSSSSQD